MCRTSLCSGFRPRHRPNYSVTYGKTLSTPDARRNRKPSETHSSNNSLAAQLPTKVRKDRPALAVLLRLLLVVVRDAVRRLVPCLPKRSRGDIAMFSVHSRFPLTIRGEATATATMKAIRVVLDRLPPPVLARTAMMMEARLVVSSAVVLLLVLLRHVEDAGAAARELPGAERKAQTLDVPPVLLLDHNRVLLLPVRPTAEPILDKQT